MDENELCSIGFMFDAESHKETKSISLHNNINISIRTIGDKPGHVQSGQYLWPASIDASNYIIDNWDLIKTDKVLELGAGCGLTGLVISKLPDVTSVIFTDYDIGTLSLIQDSINLNECNSQTYIHYLEWGISLNNDIKIHNRYPDDGFKIIIGTDLIYCKEIIGSLLYTVNELLHSNNGIFILVSSFALNMDFEIEIDKYLSFYYMQRIEKIALNEKMKTSKVEYYQRIICE